MLEFFVYLIGSLCLLYPFTDFDLRFKGKNKK